MSEAGDTKVPEAGGARAGVTAGSLLREARQAQGLHIASLAAAIKVTPRKLELLESDRLDELPDATFARALAQTVCRQLRCDPTPILALLPRYADHRLEQVSEGLNTPFRERPGRLVPKDWASLASPAVWAPLLVLVAAAVVYLLPSGSLQLPAMAPHAASEPDAGNAGTAFSPGTAASDTPTEAAAPAEPGASAAARMADAASQTASTDALAAGVLGASAPAAPANAVAALVAGASLLQVRTTAPSWVGVIDASGKTLLSRVVQPGENVAIDGTTPMKVTIGNAVATELVLRGKPLNYAFFTRDNVARLEVK